MAHVQTETDEPRCLKHTRQVSSGRVECLDRSQLGSVHTVTNLKTALRHLSCVCYLQKHGQVIGYLKATTCYHCHHL